MNYAQHLSDNAGAIFLFHGVIDRQTHRVRNYTRKHLEKDYFAKILSELIGASGCPVSLDEWVQCHQTGTPLPPRTFAITFDDGFQNNLTVAAPVLADFGIPATFYVTSDFVQSNRMSWIDRIEFVIELQKWGRLLLPWGDRKFSNDDSKRELLDEIRLKVKSDPLFEADELASDIQQQLGMDPIWSNDDALDQKMNWTEVQRLASNSFFVVGGHSHTHRILSFLNPDQLALEIDSSLDLLKSKASIETRHYSYPEGLSHCYSDNVIAYLKKREIVCCPTAEAGTNSYKTNLFHLKRIPVI